MVTKGGKKNKKYWSDTCFGRKQAFSRGLEEGNGKMDTDRSERDAENSKRRNTSKSEKEGGDGCSTGEICSHHKGNIEECLGGNSSILACSSSSSCPVFPSLIISPILLHNLLSLFLPLSANLYTFTPPVKI